MAKAKSVQAVYNTFGLHYDAMMRNPNRSSWNRVLERPTMTALLRKAVRGKSVADIGCGSGIFTSILKKWGAQTVVGVDFSRTMLKIAHERYPDLTFRYGTAAKTGLGKSSFDIVTSSMLLHYLKNLDAHFQEVHRVLKNGGIYVFSTHHPLFQAYAGNPFRENIAALDVQYLANHPYQWKMMKKLHLHGYCHTFQQIFDSLTKKGFTIEKIREPVWKKRHAVYLPDDSTFIAHFPPFLIMQIRKTD